MSEPEECEECGAPRRAGLVACAYCETRYAGAPDGISCPKCGDDNLPTQVRCASCASSLMQVCVFCTQSSSIAANGCAHCGETFEGAAERKAQRAEQLRQQQLMGLAATGMSALGQAAASPTGQGILNEILRDLGQAAMGRKK
ncbi:MAG: hypothetical protein H6719_04735 [Sandaracinaceae bacterium]|nr:hypothetical protein [Sandaracinaceae bacterium]